MHSPPCSRMAFASADALASLRVVSTTKNPSLANFCAIAPPTPQRTQTGSSLSSTVRPCANNVLRPSDCHLEVAPTTTQTCLSLVLVVRFSLIRKPFPFAERSSGSWTRRADAQSLVRRRDCRKAPGAPAPRRAAVRGFPPYAARCPEARNAARESGGDAGEVRAAVLAPDRGGVQVVGPARLAGLGRGRIAEHCLTQSSHDHLVRHDDQETHNRHEDDEVDDRGDERAQVEVRAVAAAADQLPAQPGTLHTALGRGDQRVDDVVGERLDEVAERQRHDQSDGDDDDVAAHQEAPETLQHVCSLPIQAIECRARCSHRANSSVTNQTDDSHLLFLVAPRKRGPRAAATVLAAPGCPLYD